MANKKSLTPYFEEFTSRHMTRPSDGWDYFHGYRSLALGSHYIVQDRFHLGTLAYDDTPGYTREQLRIIESWVYSTGSMIILLVPNVHRNYETRLRSDEHSKDEMFDVDRMLEASTKYREMVSGDFSAENKLGINPTYDYAYEIAFEEDGSFCSWQNEAWMNGIANDLVDEWFKRIEWALK